MATKILSRSDALAQGLTHYFTGKYCSRGHRAKRYVKNHMCADCVYEHTSARAVNDSEFINRHNAYKRERWRATPLEERQAKRKIKYEANRERAIEYAAQWTAENLERSRQSWAASKQTERAKKLGVIGKHTGADRTAVLEKQKYRCIYCNANLKKTGYEIDHKYPIGTKRFKRLATNDKDNLQATCPPCNKRKGGKHPDTMVWN